MCVLMSEGEIFELQNGDIVSSVLQPQLFEESINDRKPVL